MPFESCAANALRTDDFTGLDKKVTLPFTTATTDDYILGAAKATDLNFIADATRFTADETAQPVLAVPPPHAKIGELSGVLADLTQQHRLTVDQTTPNTFVFWSEPTSDEIADMARLMLAEEKQWIKEPPSPGYVHALLSEYLKRYHGWNGVSHDLALNIRVPDLPPGLRRLVLQDAYVKERGVDAWEEQSRWLGDEVWQRASLFVGRGSRGQQRPDEPQWTKLTTL
jgi:hypothetical protein